MRVMLGFIVLIWLWPAAVFAAVEPLPAPPDPAVACHAAVATAERAEDIPAGLLWAIARAESGRWDPRRRARIAWPWTINAEGEGHFFPSKEAAIAAVRDLQARGVRSIDVGCMQVNLLHHPQAFASLDDAFDPGSNAAYAGRFLHALRGVAGSWAGAAGRYHSATPELGGPYRERVMALWDGAPDAPEPDAAAAVDAARRQAASGTSSSAPRGRLLLAPIDHARMARIILARRSDAQERAAVASPRSLASGMPMGRVQQPTSMPATAVARSDPRPQPTRYFAQPVGKSVTAGPALRDAQAEAVFAMRRGEVLRQWRAQPPAPVRSKAPTLLRGSPLRPTTLALR